MSARANVHSDVPQNLPVGALVSAKVPLVLSILVFPVVNRAWPLNRCPSTAKLGDGRLGSQKNGYLGGPAPSTPRLGNSRRTPCFLEPRLLSRHRDGPSQMLRSLYVTRFLRNSRPLVTHPLPCPDIQPGPELHLVPIADPPSQLRWPRRPAVGEGRVPTVVGLDRQLLHEGSGPPERQDNSDRLSYAHPDYHLHTVSFWPRACRTGTADSCDCGPNFHDEAKAPNGTYFEVLERRKWHCSAEPYCVAPRC